MSNPNKTSRIGINRKTTRGGQGEAQYRVTFFDQIHQYNRMSERVWRFENIPVLVA